AQTGESAGSLALIGSLRDFIFHLTQILAGFAVRKLGYVRMMAAGMLSLVASLLLDSIAPGTRWLFISYSLLSGISLSMLMTPAIAVLYEHLRGNQLAIAVHLASSGLGAGGLLVNPLMHYSLLEFGWRETQRLCAATCAMVLAASLLGLWWSTRARPSSRVTGVGAPPLKRSLSSALKEHGQDLLHPLSELNFVLLCAAFFFFFCGCTVPYTHLVFYARDVQGYEDAPQMMSRMGAASMLGSLAFGFVSGYCRASVVFVIVITIQSVALICLPYCHDAVELEAFSRLFGTFAGIRLGIQSLVVAEFFGADRVAHLYGLANLPMSLGSLVGPAVVGAIYDATGSYTLAFWGVGMQMLLAIP
ncbi:slc16a12, partial [Symbiodinium pilosum]